MAGALLAADVGRLAAGSFGPSAAGCSRIEGSVAPDKLPARSWQDIEQGLGQPVLKVGDPLPPAELAAAVAKIEAPADAP